VTGSIRLISSNAKSDEDFTIDHSSKMAGRAIASLSAPGS
jgi:hypothetical protein